MTDTNKRGRFLVVRLSEAEFAHVGQMAEAIGCTKSELLRAALLGPRKGKPAPK